MATPDHVLVFDVVALGAVTLFKAGLADLLESEHIQKVRDVPREAVTIGGGAKIATHMT